MRKIAYFGSAKVDFEMLIVPFFKIKKFRWRDCWKNPTFAN
jgi:hypothetical protein